MDWDSGRNPSTIEKICAALAPAEPATAPVASKAFPKTFISRSPFALPSCFATVARAKVAIGSNPATEAISA